MSHMFIWTLESRALLPWNVGGVVRNLQDVELEREKKEGFAACFFSGCGRHGVLNRGLRTAEMCG